LSNLCSFFLGGLLKFAGRVFLLYAFKEGEHTMIFSLFHLFLAALALGILVFIHELGHYFAARKEGMIVEVFAIGFGRPIFSWEHKGVRWQIGILPFGGYVKIAGMERRDGKEPHEIEGGFFSKSPLARIRVALAGPFVNIFAALAIFSLIWVLGGRQKPFSEYTRKIGWVEEGSQAFEAGLRAGDNIEKINGKPFVQFSQIVSGAMLEKDAVVIEGRHAPFAVVESAPFTASLALSPSKDRAVSAFTLLQQMSPAQYLIYYSMDGSNPMKGSPLENVGMQNGDRIVWASGVFIYSLKQLSDIINDSTSLITVRRGAAIEHVRVEKLPLEDIMLAPSEKEEVYDWLYSKDKSGSSYLFIPYSFTRDGVVVGVRNFVSRQSMVESPSSSTSSRLMIGDAIIAVDGLAVTDATKIAALLQEKRVQLIVQRGKSYQPVSSSAALEQFYEGITEDTIRDLLSDNARQDSLACKKDLCLIPAVEPKVIAEYPLSNEQRESLAEQKEKSRKIALANKDPKKRKALLGEIEKTEKIRVLGVQLADRPVIYNPSPITLFFAAVDETFRTMKALFSGTLSPKHMAGPVGIVQAIQMGWSQSAAEALYWIGLISVNLGIINLLPIPVLDGGHIAISLFELITKKRVKAKAMEKLIIPFIALLLLFFIYATYNDIARIFSRFF
jgi:regulator of sigma E protease